MSTATTGPYIPFFRPPSPPPPHGQTAASPGSWGWAVFAIPSSGYDGRRHNHDNLVLFRLTTTTPAITSILHRQTPPDSAYFPAAEAKVRRCEMSWRPSGMVSLICASRLLLHPAALRDLARVGR